MNFFIIITCFCVRNILNKKEEQFAHYNIATKNKIQSSLIISSVTHYRVTMSQIVELRL